MRVLNYSTENINQLSILEQKTFAEFFAGIGLMRMGLQQSGWKIKFANDIDTKKYEMYKGHFKDAEQHFVLDDIHNLSPHSVPNVTLATASFPCNDLSLAGARCGLNGKHSSAFWGFTQIIEKMNDRKPPIIMLENVIGFLTSHNGRDFRQVLVTLNRLGYSVDAFILDASKFVPQSRQRLFVVAILNNYLKKWRAKEQLHFFQDDLRPKALADFIYSNSDICWNVRDLVFTDNHTYSLEKIIEDIPEESGEWWSSARAEYLLSQMSNKHRGIAEKMIACTEYSYGTVFRRVRNKKTMAELRVDGLAGCLRTPRGGSARQILFKAGKGRYFARLLTPRECARLMGADDYCITVPLNKALFGFGDAVCVPVISWIADNYLNPIIKELTESSLMLKEGLI
ncbi:MAG: DNA (cytosine-5-)-methyltransferase [Dethiobacter sp.]|jgi:DNA (cytosine-5)-methyltransferase 1|nr:DNA (cytosine-5-)-methyltransferase [Dethiobacter sp.]